MLNTKHNEAVPLLYLNATWKEAVPLLYILGYMQGDSILAIYLIGCMKGGSIFAIPMGYKPGGSIFAMLKLGRKMRLRFKGGKFVC
jgi:hypothetical protein